MDSPARFTTPYAPSICSLQGPLSRGCQATYARAPGTFLRAASGSRENTTTAYPRRCSSLQSLLPIRPVAPVTITRFVSSIVLLLFCSFVVIPCASSLDNDRQVHARVDRAIDVKGACRSEWPDLDGVAVHVHLLHRGGARFFCRMRHVVHPDPVLQDVGKLAVIDEL